MLRSRLFLVLVVFPVALASSLFILLGLTIATQLAFPASFPSCTDCHAHVGFPFAYLDTGGWDGPDGGLLLAGAIGDGLVALSLALGLTFIWKRMLTQNYPNMKS